MWEESLLMAKTGLYAGLDIGTTSVKVVVAEYIEGNMNVIGVGNAKSEGLKRGIIVDIDQTVDSIKRAIRQAEEKAGIRISNVCVGLPATNLEIEHCTGMIAVNSDSQEINDQDVYNVSMAAMVRSNPPERQIISVIPQEFKVDGFEGIKDPRGMLGVRLEMSGLLLTGPKTIIHNIQTTVERAGLTVDNLVVSSLATAENILNEGELSFGTILLDLGGGQTTTSVICDNELKFTFVDLEGGDNVTKDVSVVLNTSYSSAEALKVNYGSACPALTSEHEEFPVDVIGKSDPVKIDERYLSEVVEARFEEILTKSKDILNELNLLDLPGGIVLTGGSASIPGIVELASDIFGVNVKLYVPNQMGLRNPIFSNVISLVKYSAKMSEIQKISSGLKVKPNLEVDHYSNIENYDENYEKVDSNQTYYEDDLEEVEPEKKESVFKWAKNKLSEMFD
jgi:cell division protein FtsA